MLINYYLVKKKSTIQVISDLSERDPRRAGERRIRGGARNSASVADRNRLFMRYRGMRIPMEINTVFQSAARRARRLFSRLI